LISLPFIRAGMMRSIFMPPTFPALDGEDLRKLPLRLRKLTSIGIQ
jgi:hypothetical protein